MKRRDLGAFLVVVLIVGGTLVWSGVGTGALVRYIGYLVAVVILPGVSLVAALWRRISGLKLLSLGWSAGLVLELVAAGLAGLTGVEWFRLAPLLAAVALPLSIGQRLRVPYGSSPGMAAVAGILMFLPAYALVLLLDMFPAVPLPGQIEPLTWGTDQTFGLSLAAELKHHWPPSYPWVSGEPLAYHWFGFVHPAAASVVTDVPLPTVFMRLVPTANLVLLCLLVAVVTRSAWPSLPSIGAVGILLVVVAGELDPDPSGSAYLFSWTMRRALGSPSFLFGLVMFLPLLYLLQRWWNRPEEGVGWRGWVLLILFLAGAAGAKGAVLPVVVAGLGTALAYRWWRSHRIDRTLGLACVAATAVLGVSYPVLYADGPIGLRFEPFAILDLSLFGSRAAKAGALALAAMMIMNVVGAMPILWGAGALALRSGEPAPGPAPGGVVIPAGMVFAGFLPYILFGHAGNSQAWFFYYAYVAAVIALCGLWWRVLAQRSLRFLTLRTCMAVIVGMLGVFGAWRMGFLGVPRWVNLAGPVIVLGAVVAVLAIRTRSVLVVLSVVLAVSLVDGPLDATPVLVRVVSGEGFYPRRPEGRERAVVTADLLDGLTWVRENLPGSSVLAVNNHHEEPGYDGARFMYYSALTERRVLLEGWRYTARAYVLQDRIPPDASPFPTRFRINRALFKGDESAFREAVRRYGLTHLLVDRVNGFPVSLPEGVVALYRNDDVAIYEFGDDS